MPKICIGFVAALSSLSTGTLAWAQSGNAAAAAELFRQGREALEARDYQSACPKLEESQRLESHLGTAISLAECEEASGRLATARAHWQQATEMARASADPRAEFTKTRLQAIEPRVPRLTILAPADAPPDASVTRDGTVLTGASLGVALPVEVGTHTIELRAAHRRSTIVAVDVVEGENREVSLILPPQDDEAPAVTSQPASSASPMATAPMPSVAGDSAHADPRLRITAYAAGALGLLGLGIGTYFGAEAIANQSGAPGKCVGNACDATGGEVRRTAISDGNLSTAFFVAGSALVGTGIVLWLWPSHGQATAGNAGDLAVAAGVGRFVLVGEY